MGRDRVGARLLAEESVVLQELPRPAGLRALRRLLRRADAHLRKKTGAAPVTPRNETKRNEEERRTRRWADGGGGAAVSVRGQGGYVGVRGPWPRARRGRTGPPPGGRGPRRRLTG